MIRMKVRASVKPIGPGGYTVWRKNKKGKAKLYIYNKLKRRHNQRQGAAR